MASETLSPRRSDPEWGLLADGRDGDHALAVETLSELPIFQTLTGREMGIVERTIHQRHYVTGETVIRAWVRRSGMYIIQQGLCHVIRVDLEGNRRVVGELGPGDLLGEFSLLDGSPRTTSIVAAEPSDLLGFFQPDLLDLVETEPRVGFKILYQLTRIMGEALRRDMEHLRQNRTKLRSDTEPEAEDLVYPSVT